MLQETNIPSYYCTIIEIIAEIEWHIFGAYQIVWRIAIKTAEKFPILIIMAWWRNMEMGTDLKIKLLRVTL